MKRINIMISLLLCMTLAFGIIQASAASADNSILTLEEARAAALENNVQYKQQQRYIDQANEKLQDAIDDRSGKRPSGRNYIQNASTIISQDMAIENAASGVRKALFNKEDMKRSSDYSVTEAYYNVIKAEYSLASAEAELEQKKDELQSARLKYTLMLITQSQLLQAESSLASAQIKYNDAAAALQIKIMELGKITGLELDAASLRLDRSFTVPDIKDLDLKKIKEGYLQNNSGYFNSREQYKLAEYKLLLTEEQCDEIYDKVKNNSTASQQLENMLYDARSSYDDAKYNYENKLSELDTTIENQYNSLMNLYDSYETQKQELKEARLKHDANVIKHQMGIISASELKTSESSIIKAQNQLNTTLMNLNLQYLNLTQYITK